MSLETCSIETPFVSALVAKVCRELWKLMGFSIPARVATVFTFLLA